MSGHQVFRDPIRNELLDQVFNQFLRVFREHDRQVRSVRRKPANPRRRQLSQPEVGSPNPLSAEEPNYKKGNGGGVPEATLQSGLSNGVPPPISPEVKALFLGRDASC